MKTFIVDSFTKEPFKGNPAAVCFPLSEPTEEEMLKIAQEFNLSETAFVKPTSKANTYSIRYFSPKKEIPLCGHATLASAKVIFEDKEVNEIHFLTIEKIDLFIRRNGDKITMEFPVYNTTPVIVPSAMLLALGLTEVVNSVYSFKNKIILLEIRSADLLANVSPDYGALLASHNDINGVLITAPSNNKDFDYHYRYFWPWSGTQEDPVTGGVQTFLAKYWSDKLQKQEMKAFQSSARTGYMTVRLQDGKVLLTSDAVIIQQGNWVAHQ